MIIYTSVCANYIPKAKALAFSLKKHNPEARMVLGLVERTKHAAAADPDLFDLILLAGELEIEDFDSFMFKHFIVEASTAVKGHMLKELFRRFPEEEQFVYLDPDILVTGPFLELQQSMSEHDIVLTPHLCEPEETLDAILDNEICALKHGVFNLGFLAVRRSPASERFVNWWSERLREFCYADVAGGLFTDQRWIDLAPCFFDVHVFKNAGYNVAPWNLSRRHPSCDSTGAYWVGDQPLRFFHFSGLDSGANEAMLSKYCADNESPVFKLRDEYIDLCKRFGQDELGNEPWSFDYYTNGKKILKTQRLAYRMSPEFQSYFSFPFDVNYSPSFYHYSTSFRSIPLRVLALSGWKALILKAWHVYRAEGSRKLLRKTIAFVGRKLRG